MDGRELRIKVFLEEASDMPAVHKRQVHNKWTGWLLCREWLHSPTCYEARHSVGTPPSKEMQVQRFFRKVMAGWPVLTVARREAAPKVFSQVGLRVKHSSFQRVRKWFLPTECKWPSHTQDISLMSHSTRNAQLVQNEPSHLKSYMNCSLYG